MKSQIIDLLNDMSESDEAQNIFRIVSFLIFSFDKNIKYDMSIILKTLTEDQVVKLVNYFDGQPIHLPSKKDYKKYLIVSIYYYLMTIKNYSFGEVTKFLNSNGYESDVEETTIGIWLKDFKKKLDNELINTIKDLQNE